MDELPVLVVEVILVGGWSGEEGAGGPKSCPQAGRRLGWFTGSPDGAFGYDGRDYEIDLSEEHTAELDEFLAPHLEHARRVGDRGRAGRRRRPSRQLRQPREDTQAIRQWAREQGYQVSERGPYPHDVVTAHQAAHGGAS